MMAAYGKAVVAERTRPQREAELVAYLRREYGSGTGPEFLFAEMANGAAGPARQRRNREFGVFHALARAVTALVAGNERDRRAGTTGPRGEERWARAEEWRASKYPNE